MGKDYRILLAWSYLESVTAIAREDGGKTRKISITVIVFSAKILTDLRKNRDFFPT
jgi:hypothetical protein